MARKRDSGSVLITRFSALGDVTMTVPVVYAACRANPSRKFLMLTRTLPAKLFINPPENLTVIGIDTAKYKSFPSIFRLVRELKEEHGITVVVDLHDVIRTQMLRAAARLQGIAVAHVDKGKSSRRRLTRRHFKKLVQLKPMAERYREVFIKAGIDPGEPSASIFNGRMTAPTGMFSKITPPKTEGERWIAIAPFAAHPGKIYPMELMQRVVDHYASNDRNRLFIFGAGNAEAAEIEKLAKGRENIISMADVKAGIPAELALMNHCDVMLAMDSANMHMASLAGLRTVSIWGATHPFSGFYPISQRSEDAVQLELVCRPCSIFGNKPCMRGDYLCLHGISPNLIISRMDEVKSPSHK